MRKRINGHDLLDQFHEFVASLNDRAEERHDVVTSRLAELEAESRALVTLKDLTGK